MQAGTWYRREFQSRWPNYDTAPHGAADVLATFAWPASLYLALCGATTLLAGPPSLATLLATLAWPSSLFLIMPGSPEQLVLSGAPGATATALLLFTGAGLLFALALSHAVCASRSERKLAVSIQEVLERGAIPYAILAAIVAGAGFWGGASAVLATSHGFLMGGLLVCIWLSGSVQPERWSGFSAIIAWVGWIALLGVGQAAEWVAVGHGALPY